MHRRIVAAAMASVLSFSFAGSIHAAPPNVFHRAAETKATVGKMVSFSIRNDSKTTLVLKSGDLQYTIEPGKTASLKLAEGSDIVNVNGSEKQPAGTVLTKVNKQLQGNTLAIS